MIASQGKFATAPTVLVTAEHISAAFKHDAASLWVENATSSSFYICLRELQNYDGLHEDIFVVVWLLSFFWGMHIKNRRNKKHMSKSFNETYVKEKIIYIKKKLHIVANGGDEHFSSSLKTVSMHIITYQDW